MLDAFLLFIEKSKEQLAIQERQIIDLSDENEAARRSYENTEKQLNRFVG